MTNILISIKPEHVCKILNKEKTLEVRTTCPAKWKKYLNGKTNIKPEPCKVFVYCTKGRLLYKSIECNEYLEYYSLEHWNETDKIINGKVVGEFTLNNIDCLKSVHYKMYGTNYQYNEVSDEILIKSCLSQEQVLNYTNGNDLYAWYIDDLIIYDKPKELIEFSKHGFESLCGSSVCGNSSCPFYLDSNSYDLPPECLCEKQCQIKKPPQSWCYVEDIGE